jgi:hypothetical protein
MTEFTVPYNHDWTTGDIIRYDGANWKITKKTTTAIAVQRYYFWNKWFDELSEKWTGGKQ